MTTSVTVFGSANVDHVVRVPRIPLPGETVSGGDPSTLAGGKGLNQAVAAARQGQSTAFVGSVGDDAGGATLRQLLDDENVDTRLLRTIPGTASGSAIVMVDPLGENSIVVSPGANAASNQNLADHVGGQATASDDVLLLQLEVPIEAVLAAAQRWNGLVILNPAPAAPLPESLWTHLDLLVLNQTELQSYVPGSEPDVFASMSKLTVSQVVTTLGADGCAVLASDGTCTLIRPPEVSPVDTTGAGDTFCGVLAAGLSAGMALVAAATRATIAAALSTEHRGAQSGPHRATIDDCGLTSEIINQRPVERTPVRPR